MRTVIAVVVVVCACLFGAKADDSGTCGTNVSWFYTSENHTIKFTGSGPMSSYSSSSSIPWASYRASIENIEFEGEITSIASFAFIDARNLTSVTLPNSLTSLGTLCFGGCSKLTSFTIPESVVSITAPVSGCSRLKEITVAENNPNFRAIDGILYNKAGTSLLNFPCGKDITKFTVPSDVTYIGVRAFAECSKITFVNIPDNVTSLGSGAFLNCYGLTGVRLPRKLRSLPNEAFHRCDKLKMVEIPGTVKKIEDEAFYYCTKLAKLSYGGLTAPTYGKDVLAGLSALRSVCVPVDYVNSSFCGRNIERNESCHDLFCTNQTDPDILEVCEIPPGSSAGEGSAGIVAEANMMLVVCLLAVMTLLILF